MQLSNKKDKKQPTSETGLIEQLTLRVLALEDKFENHEHVSQTAIGSPSPYSVLVIKEKR